MILFFKDINDNKFSIDIEDPTKTTLKDLSNKVVDKIYDYYKSMNMIIFER